MTGTINGQCAHTIMRAYRPLTKDEKLSRYRAMRRGNLQARDELIASLIALAVRWSTSQARSGQHFEDLVSQALEAIVEAVDLWKPRRGSLSTIAVWRIRNRFNQLHHERQHGAVRVPRFVENEPMTEWKEIARCPMSIDSGEDGQQYQIHATGTECAPELAYANERQQAVREAVARLPDLRMQRIIRGRLSGETLESIGKELGVSKERVRQVERRCLQILAAKLRKFSVLS